MAVDETSPWYITITNTATIAWDSNTLDLAASTEIVPIYEIWLPLVLKNATP